MLQVFLLGAVALLFRKKRRVRNTFIALAGTWLFILTISPVPIWWSQHLENQFPVFKKSDITKISNAPVHVVVLGAGFTNDPDLPATGQLNSAVLRRLVEGVRVYNMLPNARLIGSGSALWRTKSQAEAVCSAAVELGVSASDTFQLSTTINTEDEVFKYIKRFGKSHQVIVATDALHMKRALFWFSSHGIDAKAAPCNFTTKEDPLKPISTWKPSWSKIGLMDYLIHEQIGYWYGQYKHK